MGPRTIGARSLIKAASSDGRDLARLTADRWLQKDREREQYAFKKVNIEELSSHLYVPAASWWRYVHN